MSVYPTLMTNLYFDGKRVDRTLGPFLVYDMVFRPLRRLNTMILMPSLETPSLKAKKKSFICCSVWFAKTFEVPNHIP